MTLTLTQTHLGLLAGQLLSQVTQLGRAALQQRVAISHLPLSANHGAGNPVT